MFCAHPIAMTFHAAVWLDHESAKVFHVNRDGAEEELVKQEHTHILSAHKGKDSHHRRKQESHDEKVYYESIVKAVADAEEILVLGPGTAKLEFVRHVHKHEPKLEHKIVGVESSDHPTDGQLVAHIRKYFRAKDRML